ncbi:hypothetical protein [Streptomyces sp. NPDC000351]|uniref:hypothetical protein n=1 Tax=Streptomyces sp. NPDC000351 TaxID=3154250 RepID=UPI003323893E
MRDPAPTTCWGIGSSADTALAEFFDATFERETLQGRKHWPGKREALLDSFR